MKLTIPTRLDALSGLPERLADFCRSSGLSTREETALRLVLEELVTNSALHGGAPPEAEIRIDLSEVADGTRIVYSDAGARFDPRTDAPEDTRFGTLDERPVGSLGWPLILSYCSLDSYRYEGRRNLMVFTADWARSAEPT